MKFIGHIELREDVVCDSCGEKVLHEMEPHAALYSRDGKLHIVCDECSLLICTSDEPKTCLWCDQVHCNCESR